MAEYSSGCFWGNLARRPEIVNCSSGHHLAGNRGEPPARMKHIVQFSGGLCSFFAASRVIKRFGAEGVTLLFADTLIESQGLYRFALHAVSYLQVPFVLTCDGRTPFEVFKDERFLGNTRVDLCSRILKRERCRKWMEDNCDPKDSILYVGISWDEDRIDEIRERWKPWKVEAPM